MRNKVIILCVLLILIVTMGVGTIGVAFADEIKLGIKGETFSAEEKDRAIMNLKDKFEDKDLPTLIDIEEIYDFNECPLYGLYEFQNYYMIVIRETSSILERGEGNSAYFKLEGKKYYGGFGQNYLLDEKGYKNLSENGNTYAAQEEILQMRDKMEELRNLDYQDYLEALNTPMPLGEKNRMRISMLGDSVKDFNYFSNEINIDYLITEGIREVERLEFKEVLYSYNGYEKKKYGAIYIRNFGQYWDLLYPKNVYNACAKVTMVMVLQYYERMGYNNNLIPFHNGLDATLSFLHVAPLDSRSETLGFKIDKHLKGFYVGNPDLDGAATYVDIDNAFNGYFKEYNIDCKPTHFTSYTNIKKAVDSGNPAIMTIGAGKGYDINNKAVDVSQHNVVVYGYTKNSLGVIDEFICHGNSHREATEDEQERIAMLFVNKFLAAGNVYINGI